MEFAEFVAGRDDDGRRLDRVALRLLGSSHRGAVYGALRKSLVRLNGAKAGPQARVRTGDRILVAQALLGVGAGMSRAEPGAQADGKPPALPPTVFSNEHVRIFAKPRGMSVQPGGGGTSLAQLVLQDWQAGAGHGGSLSFRPGPLHRIDRNTSGLVAFSQSGLGAREFTGMMQKRLIRKTYVGVARGVAPADQTWRDGIAPAAGHSAGFYTVAAVSGEDGHSAGAEAAMTRARLLCAGKAGGTAVSLVQFDIETGRKHQIRAQSALHGIPLWGDTAYGAPKAGGTFLLHAMRLGFPAQNALGIPQEVLCPIPREFEEFLEKTLIKWDGKLIMD